MANWTEQDPGAGDASAGATAAAKVSALNTSVSALSDALVTALAGTGTDVWASDAADAFRSSLQEPQTTASQLATVFGSVRAALEAYATEVEAIKRAHRDADALYADARGRYVRWTLTQQDTADGPLLPTLPVSLEQAARRGMVSVPHYTYADLNAAIRAFNGLDTRRQAADDTLITALVPGPDWSSTRALLSDIGITNVDDLSPSSLAEGFAEFADRFSWSDMSAEDTATVQQFFTMWGDDHSVMAIFFRTFGGESTANLIDNLGTNAGEGVIPSATALAIATAVRNGLSNGSSRWTQSTSEEFASSLMNGVDPLDPSSGLDPIPSIAYLFADPDSPMGEELAVAMANHVDQLEREYGELFNANPTSGGMYLARYEAESTGRDPIRVVDLSGVVLSTLGEYPDSAFDWLTGEEGDARVSYWFGDRAWSETGFEGPTGLWNGAIQAQGGLLTPPYDQATAERIAILTTDALTTMTENDSFDPRALSEPAQMNLAEGFTRMLPQISDILQGSDGEWEGDAFRETTLLGSTEEFPIPNLTKDTLAELFGAMAYDEIQEGNQPPVPTVSDAGLAFREGAGLYSNAISIMIADAPLDSSFATDRLSEIASLYGMMDGSYLGGELEAARLDDAEAQQAIDGITSLIGAIPIPAASELLVAGGNLAIDYAQDLTVGLVLDAGVDGVTGLWPTSGEIAANQTALTEAEIYDATRENIVTVLTELGYPEDAIDERIELVMGDYEESRDAGKERARG